MNSKFTSILIALGVVVLILTQSLFVVNERQRGVLLRFGQIVTADIEPGMHLKIPMVDKTAIFDGRLQALDMPQQRFLTQEQKAVIVDAYIKWKIEDVEKFYKSTNGNLQNLSRILTQRTDSRLRNSFGSLTLNEVVSGRREQMMQEITGDLNAVALEELGVAVKDVRVKKIDLPADVSGSVFDRMSSEREKEAQEYRSKGKEMGKVIQASAERERRVILAEAYRKSEILRGVGDAEAAAIYAKAYSKNPEFYSFHRSLQAYRESFNSPTDVLLLEPDSDFFKFLNKSSGK